MRVVVTALLLAEPTPTATLRPSGSGGHGAAFWILAGVLIAALLISLWRLRRRTSGSET